ncbi:MAG: hypothetical protein HQ523_08760 [Lentisphaerae bacterium]|nr:hypothetical protein [Lentisphaerota bacterium]
MGENATILALAGLSPDGNTVSVDANTLRLFGVSATLIVDEDGTWSIQVTIPGVAGYTTAGTYAAEGTYVIAGNRLTLTVTSVPTGAAGLVAVGDSFAISYAQSGNSLTLSATSAETGIDGVSGMLEFTR